MVARDPARRAAQERAAILSPAGRECGDRVRRLCFGAESSSRCVRGAAAASSDRGYVFAQRGRQLSTAVPHASPLTLAKRKSRRPPVQATCDHSSSYARLLLGGLFWRRDTALHL